MKRIRILSLFLIIALSLISCSKKEKDTMNTSNTEIKAIEKSEQSTPTPEPTPTSIPTPTPEPTPTEAPEMDYTGKKLVALTFDDGPNLDTTPLVLDKLEEQLANQQFLVGNQLTEADIRLFTTLVRFDAVYFGHFKCNIKALVDYPNLWDYTKRLYNHAGIAKTVDFDHIKQHYYGSHKTINPTGIVPVGPDLDWKL